MADEENTGREIDVTGCRLHERADGDCLPCLRKWGLTPETPNRHSLLHPNVLAQRFRPGQSGNPAGRAPGKSLEQVVGELLAEAVVDPKTGDAMVRRELIGRALLAQASAGKPHAMKLLVERMWPKRTIHEVNTSGQLVVVFDDQDRATMESLDEEERTDGK